MKQFGFRLLLIFWLIFAMLTIVCTIIPSPIIWLLTGKWYVDKVDDYLTSIADTLDHKGKLLKKDDI